MPVSPASSHGSSAVAASFAIVRDVKASGSNSGTPTANVWNTRDLNTVIVDAASIVSLASNQITIAAGSYYVEAIAAALYADRQRLRVRDITNSADLAEGVNAFFTSQGGLTLCRGAFTVAGTTVIELQEYMTNSLGANGFGTSFSVVGMSEIFSEVNLRKDA